MTIAAGFFYEGGVLLCADAEMSYDAVKSYEVKIIHFASPEAWVAFAIAGDVAFAKSVIDQCELRLSRFTGKPRSHHQILDSLRSLWASEYKRHVGRDYQYDYSAVIAVRSDSHTGMYVTSRTAIMSCGTPYEFVGIGHTLASDITRDLYDRTGSREADVESLAAFVINTCKWSVSNIGGGV